MITISITSSWRRALLALAAATLLGTSCQRELVLPDVTVPDGQIVFGSEGLDLSVETKATAVTSLSSFYVTAVTGSAGSEASAWNSVQFSQVPGSSPASYAGGKYWPASNPGYKFYGSNVALNFAAGGTYVNASNATDVVCAYLSSPTYNTKNTLSFEHIFARLCRVDVAAQTGYTISNISMYITPKTGGTYNLRTGAGHTDGTGWSSVATGSATLISNKTGATNNDIYMVPGTYQITCSWVSTDPSGASVTHTNVASTLPIKGGATNNISVVLGGDIMLGVDLQDYCEYDYRDNLDYLTFYCDEAGTIGWKCSRTANARTIQYSKDFGATWTDLTSTSGSGTTIAVNAGDIVWFKGSNTEYGGTASIRLYYNSFSLSNKAHVYGNVNSLTGNNISVSNLCFYSLFYNCSNLYTYETKKIILPATTLADMCYCRMFYGCTSLTSGPELPATTLASNCYSSMFENCTSLTTAPELPATTLANYCYNSMFSGCTSLTTAPELPATTLADGCYAEMFSSCYSLTSAPALPATTLANNCYESMLSYCTSLTTAPALPATTLANNCYESMFGGCTSLTTAPELPATTLAYLCYEGMFYGCESLTSAPELPATTLVDYCYSAMFQSCTSLTTAPELPATTLADGCYENMFYDCSSLNYIKALFTTDPYEGDDTTTDWVSGVASKGTFVKSVAATWNVTGDDGVPTGWTVKVETPGPGQWMDNPSNYLRFKFVTDGQVRWQNKKGDIQYSKNGGAWTAFNGATVSMSAGDEIWFKGDLTGGVGASSEAASSKFYTAGKFYASGNAQSLCSFNNTLQQYHFANLFKACAGLNIDINTPLVLPATTLASYCYQSMFQGCTSLTTAPELPATALATYCYSNMFNGCTSLTTAPELPATTLATYCYSDMFFGCTSLTSAPELPATTLAQSCYSNMFRSCTSLIAAPRLPATTLAQSCYSNMFQACTSLITAPEFPATTLASGCYFSMFYGCSSLTAAPRLRATTLASECYSMMFYGCTSLTSAPELPATTLTVRCYNSMFNGCTSLTAAPELPATTLTERCYYSMFSGCTSLTTAPELPATTLMNYCYSYMFENCTSLTTAPELPATTLANYCYNSMFYGCTLLTTAPELPATTLVNNCYGYMFRNCTSLNYIKALFTTTPSTSYTNGWVQGVASTGTFVKADVATWNVTGNYGVPTGWTVYTESTGPLPGEFSVSSTKKVRFSKSNLQAVISDSPIVVDAYTASSWKFAGHQYDFIGNSDGNISFGVNTTVDLFGWVGTSASYDSYGLCTEVSTNNEYYGTSASDALKTDWGSIPGVVSSCGSGWRTLTSDEWYYLFTQRANASSLYGQCQITTASGTVTGMLILPDNWTKPSNCTVTPGTGAYTRVTYSATASTGASNAWRDMEAAGAVFLPATGFRRDVEVNLVGNEGYYWSSPAIGEEAAYCVRFRSGTLNSQYGRDRYMGFSVRLVKYAN